MPCLAQKVKEKTMKFIDIENWDRKKQFYFFKDYDNPFYNICTDIDISECLRISKEKKLSFFLTSLFLSIKAANSVEEFRYRIRGENVVIHDTISPSSTVLNDEGTFNFCNFNYYKNFQEFYKNAQESIQRTLANKDILEEKSDCDSLIHYSVIPWISFNSVSNARRFDKQDSIPKIIMGKYYQKGNRFMLPISVEVHHSLVDGFHVAKFLEIFQQYSENSANLFSQ